MQIGDFTVESTAHDLECSWYDHWTVKPLKEMNSIELFSKLQRYQRGNLSTSTNQTKDAKGQSKEDKIFYL